MRKNIKAVIQAFERGEAKGTPRDTCHTDGTRVYSYAMLIAERMPNGVVRIVDVSEGPSVTTRGQIRALHVALVPTARGNA
jgi:hypothetical protein